MNKKYWFYFIIICLFAMPLSAANKKFVLVIDPGHGGKDNGAIGNFSKEKDLTLKFGLAFGKMVERNCPDVKVIYTRKTDVFIPLQQRSAIANRHKADLFVSVHINALGNRKQISGVQTYTLGRGANTGAKGIMENLEVAKRENGVILLEENHKQVYGNYDPNSPESNILFELMQDTYMYQSVELAKLMQSTITSATGLPDRGALQNNFLVLRQVSMPGCLLELGFISTTSDEQFMNSSAAEAKYAQGIFNAFMQYKSRYFEGLVVPYKSNVSTVQSYPDIIPAGYHEAEVKKVQKEDSNKNENIQPIPPIIAENPTDREKNTQNKRQETQHNTPTVPTEIVQNEPVFKIQILSSSRPLKVKSPHFKGLTGCESYKENGIIKYTYGASTDYNEMKKLRQELLNTFPDAFIIAFENGQKTDVQQAIRVFLDNKKKK